MDTVYQILYNLFNTYIFSGLALDGTNEEIICIFLSAIGVCSVVLFPIVFVVLILYLLMR